MTLALCLFFTRWRRHSAHKKDLQDARPYSDPTLSLLDRTKSQFSVKVKVRRSAAYELLRDLELPRKLKLEQSQSSHARNGTQSEMVPLTTRHATVPSSSSIPPPVPPIPSEVLVIANTENTPPSRRHTRHRSNAISRSSPPSYDDLFSVTAYGIETSLASTSEASPQYPSRQSMVCRWVRRVSKELFGSPPSEADLSPIV